MKKRVPPDVRQRVAERAENRCEYCRLPQEAAYYRHHADHIIPPRHGGDSSIDNLALACFECNVAKGTDIASLDYEETGGLTPLFNPRINLWDDHFRLDGATIYGTTATGRVTVRLLEINHPDQLAKRQRLINAGMW